MKNYFFALVTTATVLVACHSNPNNNTAVTVDTTNRTMLDRPQPVDMSGVSDTIVGSDGGTYVRVRPNTAQALAPVVEPAPAPVVRRAPARSTTRSTARSTRRTGSYSSSGGGSGTVYNGGGSGTVYQEPARKKGWSSAAKGTVIGAATGAVAGAVIDKKRGRGAIIGGLIGAGGGYVIGRSKDKKAAQ